jgi:DNA-directed RNA polymerase sigma subunit (sigma70/sigma32)
MAVRSNPKMLDRLSLRRPNFHNVLTHSAIPRVVFSPEEVQKLSPLIRFIKARILFEKRLFKGEKSAREIFTKAKKKDKDFLRNVIELKSPHLEKLTSAELLKIAGGLSGTYPSVSKWILETGLATVNAQNVSPVANVPYNQKLFEENKRLAQVIAHRFFYRHSERLIKLGWDINDVKQVALMGLARSTKTFDPGRKIKISTYVFRHVSRLLRQIILKKLDFPELEKLSMDATDLGEGDLINLDSRIVQPKSSVLEFDLTPKELVQKIKKTSLLTAQQKTVLLERMKIIRGRQQTFEDVGRRLKLTKARIKQIEMGAIQKLIDERKRFLGRRN